jgi:hypothetical protein
MFGNFSAAARPSLIEVWRERSPMTVGMAFGLLLIAGLFTLIWNVLHSPMPERRDPTKIIQILLTPQPPPPRPPEPQKKTMQRVPQAPPPTPIPPKKPMPRRMDSVASEPKPKPAPPKPKARASDVARPLTIDAPPDWKQFALPQGANEGTVIGGDGANGGGSGCGGASTFLSIVTSQLRNVFTHNEKMDSRTFRIQAQLWFDDLGAMQRAQLVQSTGNAGLDASVRDLLGQVSVGRGMPQCIQPITVWVSQPWEGTFGAVGKKQAGEAMPSHMEVWRSGRRP